jgi:hypothetical protein
MSKTFPKKIDTNFDVSGSLTFLIYCVFGGFSAMGAQKHYKKRFATEIVSKSFCKQIDKSPKLFFLNHVFGCYSVRGVQYNELGRLRKDTTLTNRGPR